MNFVDLSSSDDNEVKFVKEILLADYRFHEMSDGSFLVFKDIDEDHSYEINSEFGCNCPSATYRAKQCKHEKAIGFNRFASEEDTESDTTEAARGSSSDSEDVLLDLLD